MTSEILATPNTLVVVPDHVHVREFDGELVILDLELGQYYALDALGTTLWRGMSDGKTASAVASEVKDAYDIDPNVLLNDLVALCSEWLGRGLVKPLKDE